MKKMLVAPLLLFLLGCEHWVLSPDPHPSPSRVFNYLWEDIHHRYSYFEEKNIDWLEIKEAFSSRVQDDLDEKELFELLGEMLFELKDGHVNLSSEFNRTRNWEWFQDYPANYNWLNIEQRYLGRDFWISGPIRHRMLDDILYIDYRSFTEKIGQGQLDAIMERANQAEGVIVDIRSNGGGNMSNAFLLASCFTETRYQFAQQRFKNGPGKNDFSPWQIMSVRPREGLRFDGPVIVLTNRRAYSASTFFAQMMKANPKAKLLGDDTGGGGGTPVFGELPNGWMYRFSGSQTVDMEGHHLEEGVSVDIPVGLRRRDETRGIDTIIERALLEFNTY